MPTYSVRLYYQTYIDLKVEADSENDATMIASVAGDSQAYDAERTAHTHIVDQVDVEEL